MKKLSLLIALTGFAFLANAQSTTYKNFKVDIDLGYAGPTSGTAKGGATFIIEPHYRLSDDLALGLRLDAAALLYQNTSGGNSGAALVSYTFTGDYYLMKTGFRPFVGGGLGFFTQESVNSTVAVVQTGTNFGFFPRVGFEYGHLRVAADYDVAGGGTKYFGVTIGVALGGGSRK